MEQVAGKVGVGERGAAQADHVRVAAAQGGGGGVAFAEVVNKRGDDNDLIVVTGGARGVTAACALELARTTGVAVRQTAFSDRASSWRSSSSTASSCCAS